MNDVSTSIETSEEAIVTMLYCGANIRGETNVTDTQFEQFLDEEVTPRFPSGLTAATATGRWFDHGSTVKEMTRLLTIVRPPDPRASNLIDEIRVAYCVRFSQQAVLRVDMRVSASLSPAS